MTLIAPEIQPTSAASAADPAKGETSRGRGRPGAERRRSPGSPGRGGGSHPWAGVSSSRREEVEAAREWLSADRAGAVGRAQAALVAFFTSGGDASAVAALETDPEALFEVQGAAERWARGMAGLAMRAAGLFVRARAASEVAGVRRSGQVPAGRSRAEQVVDEQRPVEGYLAEELSLALGLSPGDGARLVGDASSLVERLPETLAALEAGVVDLPRALAAVRATVELGDEQAGAVERRVLARGGRSSRAAFRRALRRAVDTVDPEAAAARSRARRADRRVWTGEAYDGAAVLGAQFPVEIVAAAMEWLTVLARRAVAEDDTRTLDQARADVLASLIFGVNLGDLARREGRVVPVEVRVTVAATTLAGLDDEPGHLSGFGSIPAELARTLAADGRWRRILFDPVDGALLDVGRRRFAPGGLRDFVQVRDGTCRFPGCSMPAEACDLDHTHDHAAGGLTNEANLGPLCRRHHRMKGEDTAWSVSQPSPGYFVVTTPTGRVYTSRPEPPWADDFPATDPAPAAGRPANSWGDCPGPPPF